jgi:hypothetical protein
MRRAWSSLRPFLVSAVALTLRDDRLRMLTPVGRERLTDIGRLLEAASLVTAHEARTGAGIDTFTLLHSGLPVL